ncbi:MAG: hypothetical protein ABEI06_07315, partial [Halobacteriaceae archaeon]
NRIERFFERYDRMDEIRLPTACPELTGRDSLANSDYTEMDSRIQRLYKRVIVPNLTENG